MMNNPLTENGLSRYKLIRNYVIDLFNEVYACNSYVINQNFRKILDFESEDVFIAVTKNNKTNVISTKSNHKFKKIVNIIKSNFKMNMIKTSEECNTFMLKLYDEYNNDNIKFKIPIKESGKLNLWMDFKEFFI